MFVGNFKMNSRDIKEKNKKRDCEQSKVGSKRKKRERDNKDINLSIKKNSNKRLSPEEFSEL